MNAIAALKVEAQRIDQAQTLIVKQSELAAAKAVLEANALRAAMDASHLTAEQLIAWKNARAYETQARAIGESATRTVEVARQPTAKWPGVQRGGVGHKQSSTKGCFGARPPLLR